jgi:hypothetical protein
MGPSYRWTQIAAEDYLMPEAAGDLVGYAAVVLFQLLDMVAETLYLLFQLTVLLL